MRQPLLFVLVGGLQYLFDASLFGVLLGAGLAIGPANVTSRLCAALLGFALNRYLTFAQRQDTLMRLSGSLVRFAALWLLLTAASTGALLLLESMLGTGLARSLGHKFAVEAVLAVVSFFISKHWVYRR